MKLLQSTKKTSLSLDTIQYIKIDIFDLDIKGKCHSDVDLVIDTLSCLTTYTTENEGTGHQDTKVLTETKKLHDKSQLFPLSSQRSRFIQNIKVSKLALKRKQICF